MVWIGLGGTRSHAGDADASTPPAVANAASSDALSAVVVEAGRPGETSFTLRGADARRQLLVTGTTTSGDLRDLTGKASYRAEPEGIVAIDATGLVTPLGDGVATIVVTASAGGDVREAKIEAHVEQFGHLLPVNFPNQIVPVFTKLGCNSGGCHGKASGQNGFKLSLLGFEPGEDYEYLVKEGRGRRLFPAAPDQSLLLLKGTNTVPHGGGQRLPRDSYEYKLIRRWIAQGMPYGKPDDPKVARIDVFPQTRTMTRVGQQQLVVLATYTDGSSEDVTRTVQFDANDPEMAECTPTGAVATHDLAGDVAVMARYQGQVAVFRASVPLGAATYHMPAARNFVDELVFGKLKVLGVPASAGCDDATFLRRVTIDVAGRLPTPDETRQFVASTDPNKRDKWIDQLLASGDYADYFANKWSAVLRNKRDNADFVHGTFAFHNWIRQALYDNLPYDQFVRAILAASGETAQHPPVVWYRKVQDVTQQVEDTAQLFLGLRIQCARCHHHPFEKWSQQDYYGFAAFFSRVGRKDGLQNSEQRIFHNRGVAQATNPKTGQPVPPTGLGAESLNLPADKDPRQALVDWMADPANPFFAPALVNRYWKHFFDRGIVDPEDDMRVTNPATNPELLQALSKRFVDSGFDLKELVRTICRSHAYQLASDPNEHNLSDKQNFSRYYPKRLTAEVLLDAINQVTISSTDFSDLPIGTRAVQLPDQTGGGYFLTVFGRPQADTACECERSQEANLAQSLHLLNSPEIQGKLTSPTGRAALLAGDSARPDEEKLKELYLWVYSREPSADELAVAMAHLTKSTNKQHAYEDILWALLNTKEFLFNH
ncbi:MAG: DUF1549 domain-containing protein [Pirellulales bacterium]|nr:DUF1549 domain-containing protein [Pirellulales bacterium]